MTNRNESANIARLPRSGAKTREELKRKSKKDLKKIKKRLDKSETMWYSRQADRERAESEADIENRTTTIRKYKVRMYERSTKRTR